MRLLVVIALVVGACGSAPPQTSPPPVTPTSPPSATASPLPTATAAPAPTATPAAPASASPAALLDLCEGGRTSCELPAGTYSPSLTTPRMSFALQEGWMGVRHYKDGFALVHDDAILSFARDVTFGDTAGEPGLEGFEALLRSVSALQVEDATVTTLGGLPAVQLDVVAVEEARAFFALDEDVYNLSEGQKARFTIVDIGGVVGIFIVESASLETFDAALAAGQPVLDSIAFEE